MIKKLTTEYIDDVAIAWQGILCDSLLDLLHHEDIVVSRNDAIFTKRRDFNKRTSNEFPKETVNHLKK